MDEPLIMRRRFRPEPMYFIEGELVYRGYERTIETDSGPVKVQWPITEVVIDSISVLDRSNSKEKRGAA
jgi:hypothetical protein